MLQDYNTSWNWLVVDYKIFCKPTIGVNILSCRISLSWQLTPSSFHFWQRRLLTGSGTLDWIPFNRLPSKPSHRFWYKVEPLDTRWRVFCSTIQLVLCYSKPCLSFHFLKKKFDKIFVKIFVWYVLENFGILMK